MELWDLYDRKRNLLGRTHVRGEELARGEYHLVVDIVAVNEEGKILITKRHPDKTYGGYWETTGGSAVAGENPVTAAVRELFEETGLNAKLEHLEYCGTLVRDNTNSIHDFYFYKGEFSNSDIVLQEGETVDHKLVTSKQLKEMAQKGEFLSFVYERNKIIFSDRIEFE